MMTTQLIILQVSVHLDKTASRYFVVIKGAPECIFQRCSTIALGNKNVNLNNEMKDAAEKATEALASTGKYPQKILKNFSFYTSTACLPK